jgi:hypothetical protein
VEVRWRFNRVGHDIERRRETPPTFSAAIDDGVIAYVVIVVSAHRVEDHTPKQFNSVFHGYASQPKFLHQTWIAPTVRLQKSWVFGLQQGRGAHAHVALRLSTVKP